MMHTANRLIQRLSLVALFFAGSLFAFGAETAKPPAPAKQAAPAKLAANDKPDTYPLTTCPISGQKLGKMGAPVSKVYEGREVRFCCSGCPAKFEKDLPGNLKKFDAAAAKARQLAQYPLDTCVVSGDKLGGEMGQPVDYIYKDQLVRLCCKGCVKDFEKNPQKYLAKLDEARQAKLKAGTAPTAQTSAAGPEEASVVSVANPAKSAVAGPGQNAAQCTMGCASH